MQRERNRDKEKDRERQNMRQIAANLGTSHIQVDAGHVIAHKECSLQCTFRITAPHLENHFVFGAEEKKKSKGKS